MQPSSIRSSRGTPTPETGAQSPLCGRCSTTTSRTERLRRAGNGHACRLPPRVPARRGTGAALRDCREASTAGPNRTRSACSAAATCSSTSSRANAAISRRRSTPPTRWPDTCGLATHRTRHGRSESTRERDACSTVHSSAGRSSVQCACSTIWSSSGSATPPRTSVRATSRGTGCCACSCPATTGAASTRTCPTTARAATRSRRR